MTIAEIARSLEEGAGNPFLHQILWQWNCLERGSTLNRFNTKCDLLFSSCKERADDWMPPKHVSLAAGRGSWITAAASSLREQLVFKCQPFRKSTRNRKLANYWQRPSAARENHGLWPEVPSTTVKRDGSCLYGDEEALSRENWSLTGRRHFGRRSQLRPVARGMERMPE